MRLGIDYTGEVFLIYCPQCGSDKARMGWNWNSCGATESWARCPSCGANYYFCSGGCWDHPRSEKGNQAFYDACQKARVIEKRIL